MNYAHGSALSDTRRGNLTQVAAIRVSLALSFLEFGIKDYETADRDFTAAFERSRSEARASGNGPLSAAGSMLFEEQGRFNRLVQYRINTFFIYARIALDDIAAFLDVALPPSGRPMIGKHAGISKHLPEIATAHGGLTGFEAIVDQAAMLEAAITPFRDDFVVHRSAKQPRAFSGLSLRPEGSRISVGLFYPREGEDVPEVESADVREVCAMLDRYLGVLPRDVVDAADG